MIFQFDTTCEINKEGYPQKGKQDILLSHG